LSLRIYVAWALRRCEGSAAIAGSRCQRCGAGDTGKSRRKRRTERSTKAIDRLVARAPDYEIDNDSSLQLLAHTSVSLAKAGVDIIAPSDMMDGRVGAIRRALDEADLSNTPILSYAAKFASGFYGPFREAADSAPQFGDRRSYQMDGANVREAMREIEADVEEGADMIMVKPAMPYLDVIAAARERFDLPLAAYQVSGEYAMIEAAARNGWIERERVMMESLVSIRGLGQALFLRITLRKQRGCWDDAGGSRPLAPFFCQRAFLRMSCTEPGRMRRGHVIISLGRWSSWLPGLAGWEGFRGRC